MFRAPEVGAWRSFVAMYPESVKQLSDIAASSANDNDVMFAAAMLPTLSLSTDRDVQLRAQKALSGLRQREGDFGSYAVLRELARAPAEGRETDTAELLRLVQRGTASGDERRFLSRYGWTDSVLRNNVVRKLTQPTLRDQSLAPLYEFMAEALV